MALQQFSRKFRLFQFCVSDPVAVDVDRRSRKTMTIYVL